MIDLKNRKMFAGAALSALVLAAAGGYVVRASAEDGAVNSPSAPAAPAPGAPMSFADIVQRVAPAVVSIDVEGKVGPSHTAYSGQGPFSFRFGSPDPGDNNGDGDSQGDQSSPFGFFGLPQMQPQAPQKMQASGSGFFISPDGYIVTNNHVVEGADKITVHTKDGQDLHAHLVGTDAATDIAVIKVEGRFPYVSFEDRAKPRVGDWVVAVGNPFGLGGTATAGIVSALGRKNVADSSYVDYVQIDAPINRGNSGGPTFDSYGRVIGVNTAIYSPSGGSVGIGFDIPADVAAQVSRQLIEHGKVTRGYIGATVQPVTAEISESLGLHGKKGALVADLTPGGPAEQAGLQPGDVVLAIDGRAVDSADDLTRQVAMVRPDQVARLEVLRNGRTISVDVRSGLRPSEATLASNPNGPYSGGSAEQGDIGRVLGMQLEPNSQGGVTVAAVASDSDAADKGLARGDVILRAGGHRTANPADISSAVAQARHEGHDEVLLMVAHNGRHVFVPVKIGQAAG